MPVYFGCNDVEVKAAITKSTDVSSITNATKLKVSELLAKTFIVPSSIFSNVALELDADEAMKENIFHFGYMNRSNKIRNGTVTLTRSNQADNILSFFRRTKVEQKCNEQRIIINHFIELTTIITFPVPDDTIDFMEYSVEIMLLVINQDTKSIAKDCVINGKSKDIQQMCTAHPCSDGLQLRKNVKLLFSKSGNFSVFIIIKPKHSSIPQPVNYCYLSEPYFVSV